MACFSKADNRFIAPSKVPKNPPFDFEEDEGAVDDEEGGVGAWPVAGSPVSLTLEGVDGITGVLTAAEAAAAAAAATAGVTSAK